MAYGPEPAAGQMEGAGMPDAVSPSDMPSTTVSESKLHHPVFEAASQKSDFHDAMYILR